MPRWRPAEATNSEKAFSAERAKVLFSMKCFLCVPSFALSAGATDRNGALPLHFLNRLQRGQRAFLGFFFQSM